MRDLMKDARYILLVGGWEKTEDTEKKIVARHEKYPGFELVVEHTPPMVKVSSLENGNPAFFGEYAMDLTTLRAAFRYHREAIATQVEHTEDETWT